MTKTIIIGAGAAGLAAAQRLIKNGYSEVLILEASGQIGGRICSVAANYQSSKPTDEERRHTLELGAQWLHGKVGNVAFELASKEALVDENVGGIGDLLSFDSMTFVFDDDDVVDDIDTAAMKELVDAIKSRVDSFKSSPETSQGDFFNENFEELIKDRSENFKTKARIFKDFFHRRLRNIEGCNHWKDCSFTSMVLHYKECPGPSRMPFKRDRKYSDLVQVLARGN